MNATPSPILPENPFCSRQIRPAGVPYLFPPDRSADDWIDQLRRAGWWGQIIGPHGSGKSALLAALIPAIERAGRRPVLVTLHDGQRRLPLDLKSTPGLDSSGVFIVDGYEQLGLGARWSLKRFCRRRGMGLLVSAHASVGLPELAHTSATLELAQRIVKRLQRDHAAHVTESDVAQRFESSGGNLRELFFSLYDLYERRRRDAL